MNIDCFVLIGGHSKRLGRDKAIVEIDGMTLAERAAGTIRDALVPERVTYVAGRPGQFETDAFSSDTPVVFDLIEDRGPLGAFHTALSNARSPWIFVLACDYPFVSADLIRLLYGLVSDDFGAVLPEQSDGRLQPLCAFYKTKIANKLVAETIKHDSVSPPLQRIVDQLSPRIVLPSEYAHLYTAPDPFINVNTADDLENVLSFLGREKCEKIKTMKFDAKTENIERMDISSKTAEKHEPLDLARQSETADPHDGLQIADSQKISAETPEKLTGLRVTEIEHTAAGLPAALSTMRFALGEMGVKRSIKTLLKINQNDGFDCMSCAWADPDEHRHLAEFCENGAKAVSDEAMRETITPEFFRQYSVAELSHKSDYWLGKQGRLTEPMVLRKGATHYEPISWEHAFKLIAAELNALASPNEAIFYTSGRTSNEAAFLYQLFIRQFGTNNMPDCSNMCHESSGSALIPTIGIGKGTVKLEDFEKCDLVIIIGQNPGTNHPRMLTALEHAKANGATIIAINPLPEAGLISVVNPNPQESPLTFPFRMLSGKGNKLADVFLQVRINGDMAVLKGMMKFILEAEAKGQGKILDGKFIERDTAGFEEFKPALETVSWADIVEQSGISEDKIREAAQIYMNSSRVITCWAMGLTQHKNGVGTIQEIVNLHLLRGNIGREGAGLCPVRGHSNVQGDRTMGIFERPRPEFLDSLSKEFKFEAPREHGYDVVEAIKAMHDGRASFFFAMGGNFLSATPDTVYNADALRRTKFTAQVITKLNRTALICGEQALILPCLGRTEIDKQAGGDQFVSCENSMGVVQMSKGVLKPASEHLRSEPWIVCQLAKAVLGDTTTVDWDLMASDYDNIREKIERTIPGFDDYNARVRVGGGFYLPNKPREGVFPTTNNKANFTLHELPIHKLKPNEFVMMTVRTHDQFNTTIYGLDDRYRGIHHERRVVMLNPDDIEEFGWKAGQVVDLTSHFDDGERHARQFIVVPYDIPRRQAATYFPETNVLVPIGSVADVSNTPVSKYVVITITPTPETAGRFDYEYVDGDARRLDFAK